MWLLSQIIGLILRIAELVFATVSPISALSPLKEKRRREEPSYPTNTSSQPLQIVAGIIGSYLDDYSTYHSIRPTGRFIYIQVISGISIIFALLWSFPFTYDFILDWPMDLILSAAWFAAFGLLVNWLDNTNGCNETSRWGGNLANDGGYCSEWKTAEAFSFLSAICWLANAFIGMYMLYKASKVVEGLVYWSFPLTNRFNFFVLVIRFWLIRVNL